MGCRFDSIDDSVGKNNPAKTSTSATRLFVTDGKVSVGNFDLKLPTEIFCR
jgi:hypothetical protein